MLRSTLKLSWIAALAVVWGCSSDDASPVPTTPSADSGSDAAEQQETSSPTDSSTDGAPDAQADVVQADVVQADVTQDSPTDGAPTDSATPSDSATDTGTTDGGVQSSGGKGGIKCESTATIDTTHKACQATLNGNQFKVTEAANLTGPAYLGIYLHGDGAAAYTSNSAVKRMLTLADQKKMVLIAVRASNKCAWWQKADKVFDAKCESPTQEPDTAGENAKGLADVIEAVRAAYDIRNDAYLYYSASGGSIFLTRAFLPQYGNKYPGGMAVNCGGETPPDAMYKWDVANAALRGSTKMYFTYGDKDFLADDSHKSYLHFQGKGFAVDEKIVADAEHCAFDGHGRALEVWTAFLGK